MGAALELASINWRVSASDRKDGAGPPFSDVGDEERQRRSGAWRGKGTARQRQRKRQGEGAKSSRGGRVSRRSCAGPCWCAGRDLGGVGKSSEEAPDEARRGAERASLGAAKARQGMLARAGAGRSTTRVDGWRKGGEMR